MNLSITEQLQYATVRIETTNATGLIASGTGFFTEIMRTGETHVPCLVTNKHIIAGSISGKFFIHEKDVNRGPKPGPGIPITMVDFESQWLQHPDPNVDLAIMPIGPLLRVAVHQGLNVYYIAFNESFFPSDEDIENLTAAESILMIGYPIGLSDKANNLPLFRKGITATHPARDYEGKKEFIIDCACFPGSSGSPIVAFNDGPKFNRRSGALCIGNVSMKLLGVLYAGPQYCAQGSIIVRTIPTVQVPGAQTNIPMNLGYVIKTERIKEMEAFFKPQADSSSG